MRFRFAILFTATVLTSQVAHADDTGPRDRDTALLWSAGGTAASAVVFAAGVKQDNLGLIALGSLSLLVTPSFGEWYAGQYLTVGMGIRVAGAAVAFGGLIRGMDCGGWSGKDCSAAQMSASDRDFKVLVGIGLAAYAGGALYDIVTAPRAADAYNARHRPQFQLTPTVLNPPSGPAYGVGIGGSF